MHATCVALALEHGHMRVTEENGSVLLRGRRGCSTARRRRATNNGEEEDIDTEIEINGEGQSLESDWKCERCGKYQDAIYLSKPLT